MNPFISALSLLIRTVCDLYILVLMLKTLLQITKIDYHNPLCKTVTKLTSPVFGPLKKIIPSLYGIDLSVVIIIIAINFAKLLLFLTLSSLSPHLLWLLAWATTDCVRKLISLYIYLIIISAILSWIIPMYKTSIGFAFAKITDPIIDPIRKKIGGSCGGSRIDFSPLIVILILWICNLVLIHPCIQILMRLAA